MKVRSAAPVAARRVVYEILVRQNALHGYRFFRPGARGGGMLGVIVLLEYVIHRKELLAGWSCE
jgi:hypothetical protein